MRELIRPTLFLIAQLCLFLAVITSAAGQWWVVRASGGYAGSGYSVVVGSKRVIGSIDNGPVFWMISVERTTPDDLSMSGFDPDPDSMSDLRQRVPCEFLATPGLTVLLVPDWGVAQVTIRHWLILTSFALFYGALLWGYRNPKTRRAVEA